MLTIREITCIVRESYTYTSSCEIKRCQSFGLYHFSVQREGDATDSLIGTGKHIDFTRGRDTVKINGIGTIWRSRYKQVNRGGGRIVIVYRKLTADHL